MMIQDAVAIEQVAVYRGFHFLTILPELTRMFRAQGDQGKSLLEHLPGRELS